MRETVTKSVDELKKNQQNKSEQQTTKQLVTTTKMENLELKMNYLQDTVKKSIPELDQYKMVLDTANTSTDSKLKQVESKLKELEQRVFGRMAD